LDRADTESIGYVETCKDNTASEITRGPSEPGFNLEPILGKTKSIFNCVRVDRVLQPGVGFKTIANLIGYTRSVTLAHVITRNRTTTAINKCQETSSSTIEANIGIDYRNYFSVSDNGEIFGYRVGLGYVGYRKLVVSLPVHSNSKFANPAGRESGV
jgi:hypothetical protein